MVSWKKRFLLSGGGERRGIVAIAHMNAQVDPMNARYAVLN